MSTPAGCRWSAVDQPSKLKLAEVPYNVYPMNMRATASICFALAAAAVLGGAAGPANKQKKLRQYTAPDGSVSVVVVPAGRKPRRSEYESRIRFKSSDGKIDCVLDYSSEDNEHGFGVVKAEWTPDSKYFVFSLTSSGGHQSWRAPTEFLSRKDRIIHSLDDYFDAAGVSTADFQIIAPSTLKTEIWQGKAVAVFIELAHLPALSSSRKSKPFSIACIGGRIYKPDEP